jgi:hypothetical protein
LRSDESGPISVSRDRSPSIRELNVREIAIADSDKTELAAGDDFSRTAWALAGVAHASNSKSGRGTRRFVMKTPAFSRGHYRIKAEPPFPR